MPGFTGNKYPEELRALRAQYPDTQFDSHGRVTGGTPLSQYNAQPANPAAIPASVKTYSVFDPTSNSWKRMTNDGRSPLPINPAQEQRYIADALAQASQTQGAVYPVQGVSQIPTLQPSGGPITRRPITRKASTPAQPLTINTQAPTVVTEVPSDTLMWENKGKLQDGTPIVTDLPKDPNFGVGVAVHQPLLNVPTTEQTTPTQVALASHYRQKINPNIPGGITTKPNRVVTLGEHLSTLGNGLLGLLGWNKPTNLDPTLSNHSDPRW